MRVIIGKHETEIPNELLDTKDKRIATSDFLTRTVDTQLKHFNRTVKGSGKMGNLYRSSRTRNTRTYICSD